jgi:hypothetical protein
MIEVPGMCGDDVVATDGTLGAVGVVSPFAVAVSGSTSCGFLLEV